MDFSRLDLLVHQEAVLDVLQWANNVQTYLGEAMAKVRLGILLDEGL